MCYYGEKKKSPFICSYDGIRLPWIKWRNKLTIWSFLLNGDIYKSGEGVDEFRVFQFQYFGRVFWKMELAI